MNSLESILEMSGMCYETLGNMFHRAFPKTSGSVNYFYNKENSFLWFRIRI